MDIEWSSREFFHDYWSPNLKSIPAGGENVDAKNLLGKWIIDEDEEELSKFYHITTVQAPLITAVAIWKFFFWPWLLAHKNCF